MHRWLPGKHPVISQHLWTQFAFGNRIVSADFTLVNRMVDYSIIPLGGMPWFLARMVGKVQANELMQQENAMDAEEVLDREQKLFSLSVAKFG